MTNCVNKGLWQFNFKKSQKPDLMSRNETDIWRSYLGQIPTLICSILFYV